MTGNNHRSGISRGSNEGFRLTVTTLLGVALGFFLGILIVGFSSPNFHLTSSLSSIVNMAHIDSNKISPSTLPSNIGSSPKTERSAEKHGLIKDPTLSFLITFFLGDFVGDLLWIEDLLRLFAPAPAPTPGLFQPFGDLVTHHVLLGSSLTHKAVAFLLIVGSYSPCSPRKLLWFSAFVCLLIFGSYFISRTLKFNLTSKFFLSLQVFHHVEGFHFFN